MQFRRSLLLQPFWASVRRALAHSVVATCFLMPCLTSAQSATPTFASIDRTGSYGTRYQMTYEDLLATIGKLRTEIGAIHPTLLETLRDILRLGSWNGPVAKLRSSSVQKKQRKFHEINLGADDEAAELVLSETPASIQLTNMGKRPKPKDSGYTLGTVAAPLDFRGKPWVYSVEQKPLGAPTWTPTGKKFAELLHTLPISKISRAGDHNFAEVVDQGYGDGPISWQGVQTILHRIRGAFPQHQGKIDVMRRLGGDTTPKAKVRIAFVDRDQHLHYNEANFGRYEASELSMHLIDNTITFFHMGKLPTGEYGEAALQVIAHPKPGQRPFSSVVSPLSHPVLNDITMKAAIIGGHGPHLHNLGITSKRR